MCEEGTILCSTSSNPPGDGRGGGWSRPERCPRARGEHRHPQPAEGFFRGEAEPVPPDMPVFPALPLHLRTAGSGGREGRPPARDLVPRDDSHLLRPQQHRQKLWHEPHTRSGSTSCCSSPDSARKAHFSHIFQKGQFPSESVRGGGTLVSSSGSGQSFGSKAEQGRVPQSRSSHLPGSATRSQAPDPAGTAPSPPFSYRKRNLSPASPAHPVLGRGFSCS